MPTGHVDLTVAEHAAPAAHGSATERPALVHSMPDGQAAAADAPAGHTWPMAHLPLGAVRPVEPQYKPPTHKVAADRPSVPQYLPIGHAAGGALTPPVQKYPRWHKNVVKFWQYEPGGHGMPSGLDEPLTQ